MDNITVLTGGLIIVAGTFVIIGGAIRGICCIGEWILKKVSN
jgi:hypothetical protein